MAPRRRINPTPWKSPFTMEPHVTLAPLSSRLLPFSLCYVYLLPFIYITITDSVSNSWCTGIKNIKNHRWNSRRHHRKHRPFKWYQRTTYPYHRHAPNDHRKQWTKSVHMIRVPWTAATPTNIKNPGKNYSPLDGHTYRFQSRIFFFSSISSRLFMLRTHINRSWDEKYVPIWKKRYL